eukprot:3256816-Amphidinium_carterae.1
MRPGESGDGRGNKGSVDGDGSIPCTTSLHKAKSVRSKPSTQQDTLKRSQPPRPLDSEAQRRFAKAQPRITGIKREVR